MRRGAIIGFGAVAANGHWPAYAKSNEAKIVAVVDRTEERRQAARELIPGIETFAAIEELRAGIDFVDICTPPALHGAPRFAHERSHRFEFHGIQQQRLFA